jgi:hypothetical protein
VPTAEAGVPPGVRRGISVGPSRRTATQGMIHRRRRAEVHRSRCRSPAKACDQIQDGPGSFLVSRRRIIESNTGLERLQPSQLEWRWKGRASHTSAGATSRMIEPAFSLIRMAGLKEAPILAQDFGLGKRCGQRAEHPGARQVAAQTDAIRKAVTLQGWPISNRTSKCVVGSICQHMGSRRTSGLLH